MSRAETSAFIAFLSIFTTLGPAAAAQVGHDPAHSPYVDLRRTKGPILLTGWLGGQRGLVKVGQAHGPTYTAGFELPVSGPLSVVSTITLALTERYVVNPFRDDSIRTTGPFDDDLVLVDVGLRFNITGAKTWHGLAAYLSGSTGIAFGSGSLPDSGGYRFGKRATFTPGAGLRFYANRKLSVLVDGRVVAWRLKYPPDYFRVASSDGIPVLTTDDPDVEWTIHPWISIGLGWNF